MKNTLVRLASIFLLFTFCIADDTNTTLQIDPSANLPKQKTIFLSYEDVPAKVYVGEVFPIKVKAMIANKDFEAITSTFENYDDSNLSVLNADANWQWFSDNIFYNTYYMQAKSKDAIFPTISFNLLLNGSVIESETLQSAKTNIIKLNGTTYFSNVIAKSLNVNKYKTTYFDDTSYIIVLEIESEQSNLEDFQLHWVKRDGIDSSQNNLPFSKIFYYAIIPDYTKEFTFTYFDTSIDDFKKITLPIVVDEDKVSTQIGLNPKNSSLLIYKYALLGFFGFIFLVLFLKRRKFIYIVLIVITIVLSLYDTLPINSVKVKEATKVRILPTQNSTIFYTIDRPMYAEKLARKEEYIKILLPNGKIGWIKDESVIKN